MATPDFDTITVHYSATYPDQDVTATDVDRWHRARGYDEIGYHFFIRRNGMLETGRSLWKTGAHVKGHNRRNIGICWAGGIERATGRNVGVDNRTPGQTATLIRCINDLHVMRPAARVVGHLDLAPTQCPGFDVPAWWAAQAKDGAPSEADVLRAKLHRIEAILKE